MGESVQLPESQAVPRNGVVTGLCMECAMRHHDYREMPQHSSLAYCFLAIRRNFRYASACPHLYAAGVLSRLKAGTESAYMSRGGCPIGRAYI
jgi:hypothetical protein